VLERTETGDAVLVAAGKLHYLGAWLDQQGLRRVLAGLCEGAELSTLDLPDGVRLRETGSERFWFNYDTESHEVAGRLLAPVSVLRETVARGK
jgi:beta-galactosidase